MGVGHFEVSFVLLSMVMLLLLGHVLGLGGSPTGFIVARESTPEGDAVMALLITLALALVFFGAHYMGKAVVAKKQA